MNEWLGLFTLRNTVLTCVSIEDLAAAGGQIKDLQLWTVGGHHNVAVLFAQELHIQNVVIVPYKLGTRNEYAILN